MQISSLVDVILFSMCILIITFMPEPWDDLYSLQKIRRVLSFTILALIVALKAWVG